MTIRFSNRDWDESNRRAEIECSLGFAAFLKDKYGLSPERPMSFGADEKPKQYGYEAVNRDGVSLGAQNKIFLVKSK